jgi:hypothetical protein
MSNSSPTSTGGSESVIENQGLLEGTQMVDQAVEEPITAESSSLKCNLSGCIQSIPPAFPKFMQLPIELREKIYVQCFLAHRLRDLSKYRRTSLPLYSECWSSLRLWTGIDNPDRPLGLDSLMPNIACTNYHVRAEVFRILLRLGGAFSIGGQDKLRFTTRVFDSLDAHWPFESIQTLEYSCELVDKHSMPLFDFMALCTSLRTLIVTFRPEDLCYKRSPGHWKVMPVDELLNAYFRPIVGFTALQRVSLVVDLDHKSPWQHVHQNPDFFSALLKVGKWIKKEFGARDKDVGVALREKNDYYIPGNRWDGVLRVVEIE